jgi:uncharacterized protein YcfL
MRKFLILSVLSLGLVACEKDKTEKKSTDVVVSTDGAQDGNSAATDGVTVADDVTASVDVTATTNPAADVTATD